MTPSSPTTSKRLSLISAEPRIKFKLGDLKNPQRCKEVIHSVISYLVKSFWEVQGQWWPHCVPPLERYQVSWTLPTGWSLRACWVCWGQLCPPESCCSGPEFSRSTGRSKANGRLAWNISSYLDWFAMVQKFSPRSWDSPLAFCKRRKWSLKWQTQNTTVCSSFWQTTENIIDFFF